MDKKAIELAQSRLRIAARAVQDLEASEADGQTYAEHWHVFLTAWKGVYTVLEQGAKSSPQARQWFGGKKAARKADPLLQYLFEARNDEEHGLAVTVSNTAGGTLMQATRDVTAVRLIFDAQGRPTGAIDEAGNSVAEVVQHTDPGPELRPVIARGNVVYQPPAEHLGQRIDIRPTPIAKLAMAYSEQLVSEAAKFAKP